MFAKTYKSSELIEILSAPSYAPELVAYCQKVEKEPLLNEFLERKAKLGVTGSIAKDYVDPRTPRAVPYISTKQVKGLIATVEDAKYISASADKHWDKCRVDDGDIVINKSGNVGAAAILNCAPYKYVNSVSDIINIKVKRDGRLDKAYLVVFLNSPYGQKQLQRLSGGAIFDHVSLHAIPDVNVAYFDPTAQKYIGDKVRQAERLRAWAKEVQTQAQTEIPLYLSQVPRYENKFFKSERSELSQLRLDASFYHPDHIELDQKMRAVGCSRLGEKCVQVKSGWDKKSKHFAYFEIGGLNVSNGTIDPSIVRTEEAPSRAKTGVKMGDVLVSTVRPNRKNVAFVSEDFSPLPMVATSGFSVLRFASLEKAAFFHAWLRGDDATHQLMRWNSGSAYPAIDDDVPLNILIPEFGEPFVSEWGEKLLATHLASTAAKQLVLSAKLLVEALIEGAVTEQQLIDAQVALDADDGSLDYDVLDRLTTNGLDGDGDKLFPDIDRLYDLLTQSQQPDE